MDFIEQLKSSIDIVRVVGEYVRLKRQGAGPRYTGLCPFHSEKTPSFSVHSTHQFYKCFGCGAGGDAIKFVMEIERFTFWEAVKYLAERNGIPIPQRREFSDGESRLRQAIHEMHELAASAFRDLLYSPQGEAAQDYLKRRGLSRETAAEFGLGLSDRSGQMLVRLFEKRGFPPEAIEASGLVLKRTDGPGSFDRFRGRLMFPIHSESGQIIAFGGRALQPGEEPKYLNSSETAVYRKSQVLYNLNRARKSIQEKGYSILVEGYMDVIGVSAAGVANVVATCGTALTNYQVRSLRRHAGMLVVNFDPDKAGVNATERSIPILLEEGMNLKVLTLSDGLDPDEYIQRKGVEEYLQALENARGYFHWLADRARQRYDLYSPEGRVAAFQFLLPSIQKMPGRLERLTVANDVADYLKLDQSVVLDEFRKAAADRRGAPPQNKSAVPPDPNEVILVHALLEDDEARRQIPAELAELPILERLRSRRILEALLRIIAAGEKPDYSKLEARLDEPDRILLHEMLFADDTLTRDYTAEHAASALKSLHSAGRKAHLNQMRRRIAELSKEGKTSEAFELMRQLTEMDAARERDRAKME
jgi:DNA primase